MINLASSQMFPLKNSMKLNIIYGKLLICQVTIAFTSWGQVAPNLISYQGRLTDATTAPLPPGVYHMEFRVWDSPINGNVIWGEAQPNVPIQSNGVFAVILGSGTRLATASAGTVSDLTFAFSAPNRYLGVTVTSLGTNESLPRQGFFSAPYALASADGNPPGTIVAFGGEKTPPGWLACEGQALSSLAYSALFAAIGTRWGSGVPGTVKDFNLPDMRGVFLRGWNHGRGLDPDAAIRIGGDQVGSFQSDAFTTHNHTVSDPGHTHNIYVDYSLVGSNGSFPEPEIVGSGAAGTYYSGSAQCNITLSPAGASVESRPKNVSVMYLIKY